MSELIRGKKIKPIAAVIYGVPGVGKSTLAAGAPNPVFVGPEENDELPAIKTPKATSVKMIHAELDKLANGYYKKENFKTVVLDSIDMTEKLIHKEICESEPGKTMQTARKGYAKAYDEAGLRLAEIRDKLVNLRDKHGFNILVLGHAIKAKFNDPLLATEYDVWEMTLHKGKKIDYSGYFTEWASMVLFCNWKNYKTEDERHAFGAGKREILTEFRPSHIAKNRFGLPYSIEMLDKPRELETFSIIMGHIDNYYKSGAPQAPSDLSFLLHKTKQFLSELKDETLKAFVTNEIEKHQNNFNELTVIHGRLSEIVTNQ